MNTSDILLSSMNLGIGLFVFIVYAHLIRRGFSKSFNWIYAMKSIVGLIWAAVYGFVVASMISPDSIYVDRSIIRVAISLTLAMLAACAITSRKRLRNDP